MHRYLNAQVHVWRSGDNLGNWSLPPNLLQSGFGKFPGAPSFSISHSPAGGLELNIHVRQFLWFLQEVQRSEFSSSGKRLYPSPICLKSFHFHCEAHLFGPLCFIQILSQLTVKRTVIAFHWLIYLKSISHITWLQLKSLLFFSFLIESIFYVIYSDHSFSSLTYYLVLFCLLHIF